LSQDKKLNKIRNICAIIVSSIVILTAASTGCWALIDWRIDKKQEPIVKELVFLNCMFRVSLTPEQQQEAEALFKTVNGVGKK